MRPYKPDDSYDLRIVSLESGISRVLVEGQTNHWFSVEDWSPDGKLIAALEYEWEGDYRPGTSVHGGISLVSTENGTIQKVIVKEGQGLRLSHVRFSPNGRFLAFNSGQDRTWSFRNAATNNVYVFDIQSGTSKLAFEFHDKPSLVGWAPQGSSMLFTSNRGGSPGLWISKVDDDGGSGKPTLLKTAVADLSAIGLTRDGWLFYNTSVNNVWDFYAASVDFESGKVISAPRRLRASTSGSPFRNKVTFSENYRFIFYRSADSESAAYLFDLESEETREIKDSRSWASRIGWWWPSSDGTSVLTALPQAGGGEALYKVDTLTGKSEALAVSDLGARQIFDNPIRFSSSFGFVAYGRFYSDPEKFVLVKHDLTSNQANEFEIPSMPSDQISGPYRTRHGLLPDGRSFVFNRRKVSENKYTLILHDLVTRNQEELATSKSPIGVVFGKNSRQIFLVTDDERGRPVFRLFELETPGLREIAQVTVPEGFDNRGQHWGGPHLILIKKSEEEKGAFTDMHTLSVRTGELRNIGLSVPNDQYWGITEDKNNLLYHTTVQGGQDVWVMENFLPPVAITH